MTTLRGLRLWRYHNSLLLCLLVASLAACNRSAPSPASSSPHASTAAKHYVFKGKIISLDPKAGTASVDGEDIPGFMGAMTMLYEIHPASDLQKLHAGDSIRADLVVDNSGDVEKYWLENVIVTPAATQKP